MALVSQLAAPLQNSSRQRLYATHTREHLRDYYQGLIDEVETDLAHLRKLHANARRIEELTDKFGCNLRVLRFNDPPVPSS